MSISEREYIRSQKAQQKKKKTIITLSILAVLVIIIGVVLVLILTKPNRTYTNESGLSVGNPNSPVQVIEFSNYSCSHCKTYALQHEAEVINKYASTGKIYYTSYPYPWNEQDLTYQASLASYCAADQDKYFAFKHLIFDSVTGPSDLSDTAILSYAVETGINMDEFQTCLESSDPVARDAEAKALAQRYNVTGTPSFIVNGRLVYMNQLNQVIDEAIAAAGN